MGWAQTQNCLSFSALSGPVCPLLASWTLVKSQGSGEPQSHIQGRAPLPSDWTPGVPWAAGPVGMLTLQPAPTLSQVAVSGEEAAGAQTHHWPLGDSHMPLPSPPHSPPLLPLHHGLSVLVFLSSLERPSGAGWPTYCPQWCQRSSGRKLGEGDGHFLWLPVGDGQGQPLPPPPGASCPASLRMGFGP